MSVIACLACKHEYPKDSLPFRCECGGVFVYSIFTKYHPEEIDHTKSSMWKYKSTFGLPDETPEISLGEGNTPLISLDKDIFLKMESMNPTGSYKDRGSSVLVSMLKSRGVTTAVEDSSGNAGASFAAYSTRSGIVATIYIPESTSGPKRTQIEKFDANIIQVPGPRSEAAMAVLVAVQKGAVYASHAYMPFGLTGIATIAYEIVEQLGLCPGTVVAPVGHGGLLYGLMRGFDALCRAGIIKHEPYYLGVQSERCSPIAAAFQNSTTEIPEIIAQETAAEGVKVSSPVRGKQILEKIFASQGSILSISEKELICSYKELALKGIYVEPTSALVWAAIRGSFTKYPKPVVAVITGSGYKSSLNPKME
jgi:threonine synthase